MIQTLHTQVVMDLAQKTFTFHIEPVPFALSSMPRSHARCSLCPLQHYLWRESAILGVWEFCVNWNIHQRQIGGPWMFWTMFLTLFISLGSQLLAFYTGYALPPPAHTLTLHIPLWHSGTSGQRWEKWQGKRSREGRVEFVGGQW